MSRFWIECLLAWSLMFHADAAEKKLRVLTTFLPGYCFAVNVAGNQAEVENFLPGNVSLHDYQLSPPELRKIAAADIIVINGLGLETFLDDALRTTGTKAQVVRLTDGLGTALIHEDALGHHRPEAGHDHLQDPHTWLDPLLAIRSVTNVLKALQKADAEDAGAYARNARAYVERLEALHEDLARELAPVKGVAFVTYHNAFRYFVHRYGLNLAGVVETVPEIAPSVRERAQLAKTIRTQGVKAIFAEPGAGSRLARQIAADAGIRLGELDPLETGELKPDAYEAGMRKNAKALLKGLR